MKDNLSTLLILGAVGAGAFYVYKRMRPATAAAALPPTNSPAAQQLYQRNDSQLWRQIGGILGGLVNSVDGSSSPSVTVPGSGASGGYIGDEAVYVPDAAAVNPVNISSAFNYGMSLFG
ncbi:MAG TPA: hypothetical protein VF522_13105 [Ramlibacter sp.]|uniref:hypothetical protein n=1 Tax=Ramlibacter sp. TaxID=1917967 RepID=UPI002ED1B420